MKLKLILLFILLNFTIYPSYVFLHWNEDRILFNEIQDQFEWIDRDIYYLLLEKSHKYKIDVRFICSIIEHESGGKKYAVSRINTNNSRDYGLCQVNSCHSKGDIRELLHLPINIEIGTKYLSQCYKKANGDLMTTIRYYNQGYNGKEHKYNNWKYVGKILNTYVAGM